MAKISCIIPAYNEGPVIVGVLNAVSGHPLINEIIVVDDGSKDDSGEIIRKFKDVKLLVNEKNMGKSYAVARGIAEANGEIIFLLDADLIGLTPQNISEIIEPVFSKKADISISLRGNAPWFIKMLKFDYISGDRVFSKELVQSHLEKIQKLPHFGLEVFLNELIIKNKCRVKIVFWPQVITPLKFKKRSFWTGIKDEILMNRDIFKVVSLREIIYQNIKLNSLRIK